MGNRKPIHDLVDQIPESEVDWVKRALELVVVSRDSKIDEISALQRADGLVGCLDLEDGPADLSTNPEHMEPFGR